MYELELRTFLKFCVAHLPVKREIRTKCMSKIRNTAITDKWGFRHTCYVATATQNLKDFHNFSLRTCLHLLVKLRSQNIFFDFLDDFSLIVSL